MLELINDKQLNLAKDLQTKLNSSFQILKNIFQQELSQNGELYLEDLLSYMNTDNKTKETEVNSKYFNG